ncbi:MAG TPA: hypothetical protein DDZ51_28005, partial [Planctomycetaceae bacterium]|nr:hypothetical protein [Planctomycetaceae bacterium]
RRFWLCACHDRFPREERSQLKHDTSIANAVLTALRAIAMEFSRIAESIRVHNVTPGDFTDRQTDDVIDLEEKNLY